jgi:hypothetical protein
MTDAAVFRQKFRRATGCDPYGYQRELGARDIPPSVIEVPTGSGKTMAVLLPWLCDPVAPRRLVYALPMRSLVEQTARLAVEALGRLDDDTPVHVLMGGVDPADWRLDVDRRAVIVGTIDMLLSRALNRGYAESRFAWPVAFGLLNNDCRWCSTRSSSWVRRGRRLHSCTGCARNSALWVAAKPSGCQPRSITMRYVPWTIRPSARLCG